MVRSLVPKHLLDRVDHLAHGRKLFVVTHDYIGPDRRRGVRPEMPSAPLIEVPNPLKVKAGSAVDEIRLQEMIDTAATMINEQKIERHAVQIRYLVERILPLYQDRKSGAETIWYLEALLLAAEDRKPPAAKNTLCARGQACPVARGTCNAYSPLPPSSGGQGSRFAA